MGWMWNNLRVRIPGSYPDFGILVRIPFSGNRLPIWHLVPHSTRCQWHNSMGSNPNRRCISMEEYRPVEPVIRVRFPAAAPLFLAFHVHRGHAAQRPPGLGNTKKHKGTGGNRTPFSRTQAGNHTSRPQSHRRWKTPAQNGIRTRTNPGMLPCGIRTRACFSTLTFQLVGVERTVPTNRCNW